MQKKSALFAAALALVLGFGFTANAEEAAKTAAAPVKAEEASPAKAEDYVLTLKDHKFSPAELTVPAGQKVKLVIKNEDGTPAEFESHDFNGEKVVPAKGEVTIAVGPLKAGTYGYFDDFHEETTKGTIVAK